MPMFFVSFMMPIFSIVPSADNLNLEERPRLDFYLLISNLVFL